jgi:hypothetical protein
VRNGGPYGEGGIQFTALKMADRHPLVQAADWILVCDIDEFVNIRCGDGSLPALLQALPQADAIPLTWRLFGNGGVVSYEDAPVTGTFTRCAPAVMHWPWRAAMFKTLYRNSGTYRKTGVHRPRSPDKARLPQCRWFDGSGRELGDAFKTQRIFSDYGQDNGTLVQLNHYALGAMESFVLKAARGKVNHSADAIGMDYWVERNFNQESDKTIARYAPQRDEIIADLRADPALDALHRHGVDWRKTRFRELMLQDGPRALFSRLLMCPPSRLINETTARSLAGFAHAARIQQAKDKEA